MLKQHRVFPLAVCTGLALLLGGVFGWTARAKESSDQESLDLRYARAQLQRAEADLQRALLTNRRVADVVSADVLAEYRQEIEVARVRLEASTEGAKRDPFQVWLRRAEATWKTAENDLKGALAANQRVAATVNASDLDRLRLRAEVSRLELERGKLLTDQLQMAQLQWQMDLVSDEVLRLKEELRSPTGRPVYRQWRY